MTNNPIVRDIIVAFLSSYLNRHKIATVKELIERFEGPPSIKESEIRLVVNQLTFEGHLIKIQDGSKDDLNKISLSSGFCPSPLEETEVEIVVSHPRLRDLGFKAIRERNRYLETLDCFKQIISSAKQTIRICSPFMQKDILQKDAFPEFNEFLIGALERGVHVKLLTRELFSSRSEELEWLINLKKQYDPMDKLVIADYHLVEKSHIYSSTHAKVLACDYTAAYIGSAELRRNSLLANFEIGCFLKGPNVVGICEAFDLMFSKAQIWSARPKNENI